jgi:hypothetical protein
MPHSNAHHHRRSARPGMLKTTLFFLLIAVVLGLLTGLILFLNNIPAAH